MRSFGAHVQRHYYAYLPLSFGEPLHTRWLIALPQERFRQVLFTPLFLVCRWERAARWGLSEDQPRGVPWPLQERESAGVYTNEVGGTERGDSESQFAEN